MASREMTYFIFTFLVLGLAGCSGTSDGPVDSNYISGTVADGNTGIPIENAIVKTIPPTEVRLTDENGKYLVKNSVIDGVVFDVTASHIGYTTGTEIVTVGPGGFSGADISITTVVNGLVASLSNLQIVQGDSTGTFILSSTIDETGFSIQSTNDAFTVEPSQGNLLKNELIVIEVKFTPPEGNSGEMTGLLVANASNGGTPIEVTLSANVPANELLNPDDQFAVLVDANNVLVTNISGDDSGFLADSGPRVEDGPVKPRSTIIEVSWDFEGAQQEWGADNGIWEVGSIPADTEETAVPVACHEGTQCVGTVLSANYPEGTNSRWVSPIHDLPRVSGNERLTLRFWQWFSWGGGDGGRIQLSIDNGLNWTNLGTPQSGNSSVWSRRDIDLTEYSGQMVQIGFLHTANIDSSISSGWFLDSISILKQVPSTSGYFETNTTGNLDDGWTDWGADNGVWEVGSVTADTEMTADPVTCHEGTQCAGTVLGGNYPAGTNSRWVRPIHNLPAISVNERLILRFWQWFSWGGGDGGRIQLSTDNGLNWTNLGTPQSGNSSVWSRRDIDLTEYSGQTVQIGFLHTANIDSSISSGWFLDEVEILVQLQ